MPGSRIVLLSIVTPLLVAAVWIGALWTVAGEGERRLTRKADQARQVAAFFEQHALSLLSYGDAYLKLVRREYLRHGDVERLRELMKDVPLDRSIVSHITVIDGQGTPIFNSGYPVKPGISVLDRDYFIEQQEAGGDTLHVSLPHRGRNSGKLVVRLVRRVNLEQGAFGGVIFAALDADNITGFFNAMALGPGSSATLVGNDRRIRARSSYGRLGPGQDISGSRIWQELERSAAGLYRQTSVVDQVTRYYAYRQLPDFPLVVAIGIAVDDVTTEVAGFSSPAYAIAVLASILIVITAALFGREILAGRRLAENEARIQSMHDELEDRVVERTAELTAVQGELLRKQRLAVLGQLTGTVAHELRNPLGTIMASVAVLESKVREALVGGASSEGLDAIVARVRRNVERCNAIITELLDFTRLHAIDPQPTELDRWAAELVEEQAGGLDVAVRFNPGSAGVVVDMDRERVRRALINLIDNARDALAEAEPGRSDPIEVSTRCSPERVEVEVRDTGVGIPEDLIESIKEPLFSTKSFGIGLGLSVVQQVMEDHGGGMRLESAPSRGTSATIWFPVR